MKKHLLILWAFLLLALAGCGGGGGGKSPLHASKRKGSVSGTILWPQVQLRVIPNAALSVRVTLSNSMDTSFRTRVVVVPKGSPTYSFADVPVNSGYQLLAEAMPTAEGDVGVPLASGGNVGTFDVTPDTTNNVSFTMDSTVKSMRFTYGTETQTIGASTVPALDLTGPTPFEADFLDDSGAIVLVGKSNVTATSTPTGSIQFPAAATTSTVAYTITPVQGGSGNVATFTYKYGTGVGESISFSVGFSTVVSRTFSYEGNKDASGSLIRGTVYAPTLKVGNDPISANGITFTTTLPPAYGSINELTGALSISSSAPLRTAPLEFTVKATYAASGDEFKTTTLSIGPNQYTFQANADSWLSDHFGAARYTLTENGGNHLVYTGLLTLGQPLVLTITSEGFSYTPKIEYFANADGTGAIYATSGVVSAYSFADVGSLTMTPNVSLATGILDATATTGAAAPTSIEGYTFAKGNTYSLLPRLKFGSGDSVGQNVPAKDVTITRAMVDSAQPNVFDISPDGVLTISGTVTKKLAATITMTYQTSGTTSTTKVFNVSISASGSIGGHVH